MNPIVAATTVGLLALGGIAHGLWTHRWEEWTDSRSQSRVTRIDNIPMRFGDWQGEKTDADPHTLPEEVVGRGVSVRFVNRTDGTVVVVYLACGPTDGIVSHTPRACYPSNGYTCPTPDLRVRPLGENGPEFWASTYSKPSGLESTHLRILWAWSDGSGWQIPGNARRTFRKQTVIYKLYAIRQMNATNEPLDGDPSIRFLTDFLPQLDAVLTD